MLGILAAFGVVVFKSATDITFKFANRLVSSDLTLLLYQRSVESLVALVVLIVANISFDQNVYSWLYDGSFWALALITVVLGSSAFFCYVRALRFSDASLVAPMMLLTPAILLITSPIMLGEYASPLGAVGVIFIVFGSYFIGLSLNNRKNISFLAPFKSLLREKGVRYALLASFLYGITSNLDKMGVLQSSPYAWIFIQGILLVIVLGTYMLIKKPEGVFIGKKQAVLASIPGVTGAISSILQMVAISLWNVSYVIAVKRLSSLSTIIAGGLIFKEKGILWRLVGASFMVVGVLFILFFG